MKLKLCAVYSEPSGPGPELVPRVFEQVIDLPYPTHPMVGDTIMVGEDRQPLVISERTFEDDGSMTLYFGGFGGWKLPDGLFELGFVEDR